MRKERETLTQKENNIFSVSVIIPTLNAGKFIGPLIEALKKQSQHIEEILVIDSSSNDDTVELAKKAGARVVAIPRSEFNHGGTRHKAFLLTKSEFVLFMTQDAYPANNEYVENLLFPFKDRGVAMASGRQLARKDARPFEKLTRGFNYPPASFVRSMEDVPKLGIKAFFASDVCSAYRRKYYLECGGFDCNCNTNEDMLMAAKFIAAGYKVAYAADAEVIHSHNLSLSQQYRRNKEIGIFLKNHKFELMNASEYGEGKRMVLYVMKHLFEDKQYREVLPFFFDCVARYCGNKAGKLS